MNEKDMSATTVTKAFARRRTRDSLGIILTSLLIKDDEDLYLENDAASSLYINLLDLPLEENDHPANNDSSCFFSPMPSNRLKSFPFDKSDPATERFLDGLDSWDESRETPTGFRAKRDPESLICKLNWLFSQCRRISPKDDKTCLRQEANWKHMALSPEIFHNDLFGMVDRAGQLHSKGKFGRLFDITDGYCAARWDIRISEPHIIVMIEHEYVADEKISRAEVSTILAVMITQLRHGHLEEHCIPPVMLVSFMGSLKGRILQAHVTDSGLVIKKSKLYDFDKQVDFERSITLFTRHMASDRIGDTRQLTMFDLENKTVPILHSAATDKSIRAVADSENNIHESIEPYDRGLWELMQSVYLQS
ncbi:hypothetical protein DTO207G8_7613 [Paecilomyces variotii]|nr:hypothetical protein DTO207G8_7613 [Paecilomyces variotii]